MPKLAGVLAELNVARIDEINAILKARLDVDTNSKLKAIYEVSPTLMSHGEGIMGSKFAELLIFKTSIFCF